MAACVQCGRELPPGGEFCPGCGTQQTTPPVPLPANVQSAGTANVPASPPSAPQAAPINIERLLGSVMQIVQSLSRWDAAALGGGALAAGLWYAWSKLDVKDTTTPKYIMLMPILIVVFRKPIDAILRPIQVVKQRIPRLVLIAAGLAAPYLVAHFLYDPAHQYGNEWAYAQKSIIWGTIVSYLILRIPAPRLSVPQIPGALLSSWLFWMGALLIAQWALTGTVFADDFLKDFPHNIHRLQDGLRTPGAAEGLAGTAGTVISGLVNGALVFQSGTPSTTSDTGEKPTHYTMDVRTEDERTTLAADDKDRLWVYAQIMCNKPEIDVRSLTAAIAFSFQGKYSNWLKIKQQQFVGANKAILLAAEPPTPEAELEENATVIVAVSGATADGEPIEVPVTISLQDEPRMEVDILA